MPLDRRIKLRVEQPGTHVGGSYVPGPSVTYDLWAQRSSLGTQEVIIPGGTRTNTVAEFTIRWTEEIYTHRVDLLFMSDAEGFEWRIDNMGESDTRRKFLAIQAVRVDPN